MRPDWLLYLYTNRHTQHTDTQKDMRNVLLWLITATVTPLEKIEEVSCYFRNKSAGINPVRT